MNIVCLHSCAADSNAIGRLLQKCELNHQVSDHGIEGRYVLAYHNSELIGMADLAGEVPTCVLHEYNLAHVLNALQLETMKIRDKFVKRYMIAKNN